MQATIFASDDLASIIETYSLIFEPLVALPRLVRTPQDICNLKTVIKLMPCTDETVTYLAEIILAAALSRKRFRKVECLKVLRAVIRNSQGLPNFSDKTIRLLFQVYKYLIFNISENGQWAASTLIKGQLLEDPEIQWLIQNYMVSVHPLNRLLLYPEYHPAIAEWAKDRLIAHELPDRTVEVIALCIHDDIPSFIVDFNNIQILQAVCRARITLTQKQILLIKLAQPDDYKALVNIALRYQMSSLFHYVRRRIEKQNTN